MDGGVDSHSYAYLNRLIHTHEHSHTVTIRHRQRLDHVAYA